MMARYPNGPRLLADVGGTNARFTLEVAPGRCEHIRTLACDDYPGLVAAARAYLDGAPKALRAAHVRHAGVAIANPVDGDQVRMTNRDWHFSIEAARRALKLDSLRVVNDFTALAMAVPRLDAASLEKLGGGKPRADRPIALVGPGTGLGVAALIPVDGRWVPIASEGGHTSFAPADAREMAVLRYAWQYHSHVSFERLVSGPGIELLYRALAAWHGRPAQALEAAQIVEQAARCPLCAETVECFSAMLGGFAGNVAVMLNAAGGVYIGGGVVPKMGKMFDVQAFRRRFEAHGRYAAYLANIPIFLIDAEFPAFTGVSAILAEELDRGRG